MKKRQQARVSRIPHTYDLGLELEGIRVWLGYNDDGKPVVIIDTPQNSDAHEKLRVYMNDAEATTWT